MRHPLQQILDRKLEEKRIRTKKGTKYNTIVSERDDTKFLGSLCGRSYGSV